MSAATTVSRIAVVVAGHQMHAMNVQPYVSGAFALIPVADVGGPDQQGYARVLRRVGPVVDSWGKTPAELATELAGLRPDGVVTLADANVGLAADLARRLGLPGHSAEAVRNLTDKLAQRTALRDAGLITPAFWRVDGPDDDAWSRIAAEARFPAVLKPRTGSLSRDVTRVACVDEARAALRAAKDLTGGFLLEEYIPDAVPGMAGSGFDGFLSVESLVWHGEITHIATTGRAPMAKPFRSGGAFIPSELREDLQAAVLETASSAITALGVTDGCLHIEIKLTPLGPVVIEVNGRMGGKMDELTARSSGFRYREQQFRIAAGLRPLVPEFPVPCERVGFIVTQQAPLGMRSYARLIGIEAIRDLPGVEEISIDVPPGDSIDWRDGTQSKLFSVEGSAADHDELRVILAACARVQIITA